MRGDNSLDVLIAARNEMFLSRTIEDVISHIEADTEVIAVIDGGTDDPPIKQHPRVNIIRLEKSIGQRAAVNLAARESNAKYIMKLDAHCSVDQGFDRKLIANCEYDWTVIPEMRNLHAFNWLCEKCGNETYQGPTPIKCDKCDNTKDFVRKMIWLPRKGTHNCFMRFDSNLHFQYWSDYKTRPESKGDVVECMSLIGAGFFLHRERYWDIDGLDEGHGSWGQMGTEIACKSWLSGGKLMANKKTWFAHMFRTQGGDFSFPYHLSGRDVDKARKYSINMWKGDKWPKATRPFSWLIDKFWPIPGWEEKDKPKVMGSGPIEENPPSIEMKELTKGIVYYTDNQLDPKIDGIVKGQLNKISQKRGIKIVSVSLKPIDFGQNIVLPLERGTLTMTKQILAGLEAIDTDIVFFCFQGNTYIETNKGLRRIDNIKVGDMVKTHLGRFMPVTTVFKRPYKQRSELIQIDSKFNNVRCTPEHPFFVYKNNRFVWVPANKLMTNDMLLYPDKQQQDHLKFNIDFKSSHHVGKAGSTDKHIEKILVDTDLARFLGLYVAEGHYNGKNGIGFTFSNKETDLQNFIYKVCKEKFGRDARIRKHWATQILINIQSLGPLFSGWFGKDAKSKHIPEFVFSWGLQNKLAFILGLLEGDGGGFPKHKFYTTFSSASKELINDLQCLMAQSGIGWGSKILKYQNANPSNANDNKCTLFVISLSKHTYTKLCDLIYATRINKNYLGIPIINIKSTKMSSMPKFKKGERVGYSNYVYNLEVAKDNSYIVESMIVHNCEHDVIYHPCHFDFSPLLDDVYWYNENVWKVRSSDGQAVFFHTKQTSGCCATRKMLLEHYRKRVARIENEGFHRTMGFEPGCHHLPNGVDNFAAREWWSVFPNVDIRHATNLTWSRFKPEQYRSQRSIRGWNLADEVPYWGRTKGRFEEFLNDVKEGRKG